MITVMPPNPILFAGTDSSRTKKPALENGWRGPVRDYGNHQRDGFWRRDFQQYLSGPVSSFATK